jgi:CheY-like chemotaxis protein
LETWVSVLANERILVVTDEPMMGFWLEDTLPQEGYEAVVTAAPEDALRLLRVGGFAAVVTQISFRSTRLTGWDVATLVRQARSPIPVVYVTASQASDWTELGVQDSIVLSEPVQPSDIRRAITRVGAVCADRAVTERQTSRERQAAGR